ncbi:MAG: hypothetical protein JWM27_3944 [Gemmatimonadetes bacterium]|nr:hypothetical protein [Gemmatimonadota bacterium]
MPPTLHPNRRRPALRSAALARGIAAWLALGVPAAARAQLRPVEPVEWRVFTSGRALEAEIGGSVLRGQRASLAGTQGDLVEAGTFRVAWRTGRVALEGAGTLQRFFHDRSRFAPVDVLGDVSATGPRRHDSGDYRIQTVVRLTPDAWRSVGALRFGTRLPTTDNTMGLDRDATDFFVTVGGRTTSGALAFTGDAGLGIFGTREPRFEQDDLLLYSAGVSYESNALIPSITFVGQKHGSGHREIRGNEDLGEVRVGLRTGTRRWMRVEAVHGYERTSPRTGLIATAGVLR